MLTPTLRVDGGPLSRDIHPVLLLTCMIPNDIWAAVILLCIPVTWVFLPILDLYPCH